MEKGILRKDYFCENNQAEMRAFGIITWIVCTLSIIFFLVIAVFGASQYFIPSLLPLPILVLQLLLTTHSLRLQNPKPEQNPVRSSHRYKINAILLTFVSIIAISIIIFVLIRNNDILIHYGMEREIIVSKCLVILGSIMCTYNILSLFQKQYTTQ